MMRTHRTCLLGPGTKITHEQHTSQGTRDSLCYGQPLFVHFPLVIFRSGPVACSPGTLVGAPVVYNSPAWLAEA